MPGVFTLLACDNCTVGNVSSAENWIVISFVLGALSIAVLMWVAGRILLAPMRIGARLLLAISLVGLLVSPWFMLRMTDLPSSEGGGVACGSALHASLEQGIPTDSALDWYQTACKTAGQQSMRMGLVSYAISAAFLILALVLMLVGWIARLSANHPTASMQSTPLRLDNL